MTMTPAIQRAREAKIHFEIHRYEHDPGAESYGEEAADKLGIAYDQVFKTLIVSLDQKQLAVAVVPVARKLDLKAFAEILSAKKASMAAQKDAERATGYVLGGISPLGQKKKLRTVIDSSAVTHASIFVSAGKRGLEIELSPGDLAQLVGGQFAAIAK
jgi:Cys-tRNA(Pro)/Cys-tRNA(Cys) deacylase